ncbi:hypothetical protein ACLQ2M_41430, partial [Streptomyces sp. DT7]
LHLLPLDPPDDPPALVAAAHASLEDPEVVAELLGVLRLAEADEQDAALLARDPAAHSSLEDPEVVAKLLEELR